MRRFIGDRQGGRRLLFGLIAIVILLAVDIVLIALAMRAHDAPQGAAQNAPSLSGLPEPTVQPSDTEPPASEPASSTAAESDRIIAAIGASSAWRADVGSCADPGSFEMTADGGLTWEPAGLEVTGTVFALEPSSDGRRGTTVVADEQCTPVAHRTFTAGVGWERHPVQSVGTYVTDEGTLVLNGSATDAPCDALSAAVGTGGGVILCDREALARTDGGSWVSLAQNVVAIGPADAGVALALASSDSCEGLEVGIVVGGGLQTACSSADASQPVAVSASAGQLWLWVGDAVEVLNL